MAKRNSGDSSTKLRGEEGFEAYYSRAFGERWPSLRQSLFAEPVYATLCAGGSQPYYLDCASVCAALCLPVQGEDCSVMDLCAAPGGKTLVLSCLLRSVPGATLCSNERSADRKHRLDKVVQDTLDEETQARITTSCKDGAVLCRLYGEKFDYLLLDAPCSSERHVIQDQKYLSQWSPSRVKTISMEQWALLSSAYRMLKAGGSLLYATCALAPDENDGVVARLVKKFPTARIMSREEMGLVFSRNLRTAAPFITVQNEESLEEIFSYAMPTEYGLHILPDAANGAGPLYFSLITKDQSVVDD